MRTFARIRLLSAFLKTLLLCQWAVASDTTDCPPQCECEKNAANCSRRSLAEIPFGFSPNLTFIDLSVNDIPHIPAYVFMNATNVEQLDISANKLMDIDQNAFVGLSKLYHLSLMNNVLKYNNLSFISGVFIPLVKLTYLNIGENADIKDSSSEYPDVSLRDLRILEYLQMDGLTNKMLGNGFRELTNLKTLVMSGHTSVARCNLQTIRADMFLALERSQLKHLMIQACKIHIIYEESFSVLHHLEKLDMAQSQIPFTQLENLTVGLLNTSIKVLNLHNQRDVVDVVLTNQMTHNLKKTSLRELDLSDNGITWIDAGWVSNSLPSSLTTLSLYDNYLLGSKQLAKDLLLLYNLTTLRISFMRTVNFQHLTLLLPIKLKTLEISRIDSGGYPIPPVTFANKNGRLRSLTLSEGDIVKINGPIKGLHELDNLELSSLKCFALDFNVFDDLPRLLQLNLQNNVLGDFLSTNTKGGVFQQLGELKLLNLNRNYIERLPIEIFIGLLRLETLILAHNAIESFDVELSHMHQLTSLDLSHNMITSLPNRLLPVLDALAESQNITINLRSNSLKCDCDSFLFLMWMQKTQVTFQDLNEYTCTFDNKTIAELDNLESILLDLGPQCASYGVIITLTSCCILIFMVLIFGKIWYLYRLHIYYLFYAAIRKNTFRGRKLSNDFKYDAFVSFDEEDRQFVVDQLSVKLESMGCRLCIPDRDYIPSTSEIRYICNAIHSSRKAIMLVSNAFLQNSWCQLEIDMCLLEELYSNRKILICVQYESINNCPQRLEMLRVTRTATHMKYPAMPEHRELFWTRLADVIKNDMC